MKALPVWVNGIFLRQPSENKISLSWSALMSRWWWHVVDDNKHLVRLMRLVSRESHFLGLLVEYYNRVLQGTFNQHWHMNEEELY